MTPRAAGSSAESGPEPEHALAEAVFTGGGEWKDICGDGSIFKKVTKPGDAASSKPVSGAGVSAVAALANGACAADASDAASARFAATLALLLAAGSRAAGALRAAREAKAGPGVRQAITVSCRPSTQSCGTTIVSAPVGAGAPARGPPLPAGRAPGRPRKGKPRGRGNNA